jgi:phage terminase large subunit
VTPAALLAALNPADRKRVDGLLLSLAGSPLLRFQFHGANRDAYRSTAPELLLAGPAGTGKSYALLARCYRLLESHPGCRVLFCRGTRASLTQSGLVTWEKILGERHPVLTRRPVTRRVRQSYEFPNGSEMVVAGLDDPGKTLSSEYDAIYIQEATEEGVTLETYETLLRSLRNGKTPCPQILMDCNPTTPTHWLYRRQSDGPLTMLSGTHKDNPAFYLNGDWTPAGKAYLETLGRMTGARRNRFERGLWVSAEGLVYDGYDPQVHHHPAGWEPPKEWRRVWGIDWGFVQPLVVQMWAIDGDKRMHLYREIYKTRTRVEEVAKECAKLVSDGDEPPPEKVVADHDPENTATWNQYCKGERTVEGKSQPFSVHASPADKRDRDKGIQLVQGLFDVQADGKPRIMFRPDARRHRPDPTLKAEGKPLSLLEEIVGYTWKVPKPDQAKDEPIEHNDHSCDCLRYVSVYVNSGRKYFAGM